MLLDILKGHHEHEMSMIARMRQAVAYGYREVEGEGESEGEEEREQRVEFIEIRMAPAAADEDRIGHRHRRALFASSSSLSTKSRHRLGALAAFLVILTLVFFNCFSVQRLAADLIAQLRPRNQTETINKRTENEAEKNNNSQMAEGIWCFFLHFK